MKIFILNLITFSLKRFSLIFLFFTPIILFGQLEKKTFLTDSLLNNKMSEAYCLRKAYELDDFRDHYLFIKAESLFKYLFSNDTLDYDINYNLAALYYNEAGHWSMLSFIDSVKKNIRYFDECAKNKNYYYNLSLPYFKRAIYRPRDWDQLLKKDSIIRSNPLLKKETIVYYLHNVYVLEESNDKYLFKKIETLYKEILAEYPDNYKSINNLAALYENEASYWKHLSELDSARTNRKYFKECTKMFKKYKSLAKPYEIKMGEIQFNNYQKYYAPAEIGDSLR